MVIGQGDWLVSSERASSPGPHEPDAPARGSARRLPVVTARAPRWRVGLVWIDSPEIPVTMRQSRILAPNRGARERASQSSALQLSGRTRARIQIRRAN